MPEIKCEKCGTTANLADLFCRNCGNALNTAAGDGVPIAQQDPTTDRPEGGVNPPVKAQVTRRSCCLFSAAALVFFILAVGAAALFTLASLPGGLAAVKVEIIGNPTPYPTHTPYPTPTIYRTASPYRTQTTYPTATLFPTQAPYPTTGPIRGPRPTGMYFPPITIPMIGGCRINVKNQNATMDAVVILADSEKGTTTRSFYVRSGESYSASGISTGTYYTYITVGQNWDSVNSRFSQGAAYFRFEDPTIFTTCASGFYGSYQYLDITLNVTEGPGSDTISVPPDSFPKLGQ